MESTTGDGPIEEIGKVEMSDRAEIERAETDLREAMLTSDVDALDALIGEDAVFTNQGGRRMSKADDLAIHRSGLLKIERLDAMGEPIVRVLGDAAVVCITVDLAGAYDGQPFGNAFAYTRIWHRRDGRWQVEAAHCSMVGAS